MPDGTLVLGIDIGTSSSKGVLVDGGGTVVARAETEHATSFPQPGWVEHDAEGVWWSDVTALLRELLPHGTPDALGVSGIGPVLLPADAEGRPLRPAILYGVDTRATREIAELTEEVGAEAVVARGGTPLSSQAVGPKWRWLQRHEPDVYARTERFLMASSYAVHRLTGEYVLDHHSASQCDPMYDLEAADWARDLADVVAPGLPLPRLVWPGEVAGTVTDDAARATGLPAGVPVIAGTVDAWAEAASVGVTGAGDTMVMYGTTMFLVQVTDAPVRHPALWATRGVAPGSFTTAAGMATSGAITAWLRDLVGADYATLLDEAADVPPGARGLLLLPYFAGERTPILDPDARGLVLGLTTGHGRAELYRAALEGIAHGVRHNLEAFRDAGGPVPRLVAVGGGTRGGLWTQIVSDVIGQPQEIPADTTGAALGDALLAARALGLDADAASWNPIVATVTPDPERTARYDAFHEHYRALYPATADAAHFLAEQQRWAPPG
ncbi:FGGY-family carbohydrate kinase [Actinomycetospora straminea]|uniref:FGGY-family carbohydrate kinase n=1 Tax=Actinomycetospora straminea TaxID=663607 RepID=UPI00236672A3|nr:FGGY-family carbohydrate kinase [Actinomycetospora straminea]MDD7933977.1 FGGY-family carbohydrate kinase [Actinomycetospora straminea]